MILCKEGHYTKSLGGLVIDFATKRQIKGGKNLFAETIKYVEFQREEYKLTFLRGDDIKNAMGSLPEKSSNEVITDIARMSKSLTLNE